MSENKAILADVQKEVAKHVSEKRRHHIDGVVDTALEMVNRLSLSEQTAFEIQAAAYLHDITKELDFAKQVALYRRFSLPLTVHDKNSPAILHSRTGAEYARMLFPSLVNDAVYSMIYNHATGRKKMSTGEKIVFLADYIEPGRTYPSCENVREQFFSGKNTLDDCVLHALEDTIKHILEEGGYIHPQSIEARNFLCLHKNK